MSFSRLRTRCGFKQSLYLPNKPTNLIIGLYGFDRINPLITLNRFLGWTWVDVFVPTLYLNAFGVWCFRASVWSGSLSLFVCRTFASSYLSFCTSSSVAIPSKWVCPEAQRCSEHKRRRVPGINSPPEFQTLSLRLPLPHCPWDVWALIESFRLPSTVKIIKTRVMFCHHGTWIFCYLGGMCVVTLLKT